MKNTKKQSLFMSNVLTILWAQIAIKLMGLVYRLVITNIQGFGDLGNGFNSAGFQLYTLLLAISSVGIPNAISKLVSEAVAQGNRAKAHQIFQTAFRLFCGIGLLCAAGLYFGADFIAIRIIRMNGVQYTLQALSPSILFVCLSSVIRGYFVGLGDVSATSLSQMLEQAFKATLTIVFVLMLTSFSAEIMSAGANFATSVATMLSFAYLSYFYLRRRAGILATIDTVPLTRKNDFWRSAKHILMLSIPISFSSIIIALGRVIDTATITRGITYAFSHGIPGRIGIPSAAQLNMEAVRLAGILSKSDALTNLPLALNIAFSTVLVPTISAALITKNKKEASSKISLSLMISILLILPCTFGFITLAKPIFLFIYPNAPLGCELLQISSISMMFAAMDQTIFGSLQGLGKVSVPATALLFGVTAKFILNIILIRIPSINIYGAAISSVVCHAIAFSISLYSLRKEIKLALPAKKYVIKPFLCSIIMSLSAAGSYWLVVRISHSNALATLFAVIISMLVYAFTVLKMHILTDEEIDQLPFNNKVSSLIKHFRG